jgi:hypothetical protein
MADNEVVDLDEMLAARHEARGDNHTIKLGGKKIEIPPKVPSAFIRASAKGDIDDMAVALFGDNAEHFWECVPDWDDAEAVLNKLGQDVYGITPGESRPSAPSSNRAGRRSRATSNGISR